MWEFRVLGVSLHDNNNWVKTSKMWFDDIVIYLYKKRIYSHPEVVERTQSEKY